MVVLHFLLILLLFYILIRAGRFLIYQRRLYQTCARLPGPEIRLSFIGNLDIFWNLLRSKENLSQRLHARVVELCDSYGQEHGFFRLWLGPFTPWIIVCDAKLARKVLSNPAYQNKSSFYRLMEHVAFGTSLFTSSDIHAKQQRKGLKEFFTLRYLELYFDKMVHHLGIMEDRWEDYVRHESGIIENFSHLVSTYVYDTVGDNLFSSQFNSITTGINPPYEATLRRMIHSLEFAILQPWRYIFSWRPIFFLINGCYYLPLAFTWPLLKNLIRFHSSVQKIVLARYHQLQSIDSIDSSQEVKMVNQISLLDSMLRARVLAVSNVIDRLSGFMDVMYSANMFIIAGHDTSTATISWIVYMLAHHPEKQRQVQQEMDAYLAERADQKPNFFNLKLPYLEACIKETLRLRPIAPFIGRSGAEPIQVSSDQPEIILPPHLNVLTFFDYMQTQEKYFPDAEKFKPERFMETSPDSDDPNLLIMPFSLGARGCLGRQYSMIQMKLFCLALFSRYDLEPLDVYGDQELEHHFLTKPPNFSVKILPRCG